MLSAIIVRLDGRPVAFSFDVHAGDLQYGIAGTYDQEFRRCHVGKLAIETSLLWAAERGVTRFDWGAGDSGYKTEMGFKAGPEIVDCLFVRRAAMARVLRSRWERNSTEEGDDGRRLPIGPAEALVLASLATAAAVTAMAE
jgi:CelD/BcsL family acetyltransferase involved in cellulose biosynthesis